MSDQTNYLIKKRPRKAKGLSEDQIRALVKKETPELLRLWGFGTYLKRKATK